MTRGDIRLPQRSEDRRKGGLTTDIEYILDGLGRRVGKKVNGVLVQQYVWSSELRIEASVDANGDVTRYVYGNSVNTPELVVRPDGVYRVISDLRGSPVLVVDVEDGTVLMEAQYDAWGNVLSFAGPGGSTALADWPIAHGFAGGLFDSGTGLVRFGARDYSPEAGRWTANDPILFGGGQTNLYVYVGNDPVQFTDPEGLWVLQVAGGILGGAAAAYSNYNTLSGTDYAASIAFGVGAGVLASLPTSIVGGVLAGAAGSGSTTLFSQALTGNVDAGAVGYSALFGAGAGFLGGAGAEIGRNVARGSRVLGDVIGRTYVSGGVGALRGAPNYGSAGGICGNTVGTGLGSVGE